MTSLALTVGETFEREDLRLPGKKVMLAVSGGIDSMVLLSVMLELREEWDFEPAVFHFNHQLRGAESEGDAVFVQNAAEAAKLPFYRATANVRGLASEQGISAEMAARQARHAAMAQAAAQVGITLAATAHHADDQVELFFVRVFRGSGSEGLAGMRVCNPSPADRQLKLVRPFLTIPKDELRDYARRTAVQYREDSSNTCPDFLRNRIRHELLPLLARNYSPSLRRRVLSVMETARAEGEVVNAVAIEWLTRQGFTSSAVGGGNLGEVTAASPYESLPRAVQRRVLLRQLHELGVQPTFELVERLRLRPRRPVAIPGGLLVRREGGLLRSERPWKTPFTGDELLISLESGRGSAEFCSRTITWQTLPAERAEGVKAECGREVFDAEAVGPAVTLRHWRAGDRFQPIGMASEIKVQDYFTNEKVLRKVRHELIFACTGRGEVFWIEGMRISERFKLTPQSKRRLLWSWSRH